MNKEQALQIVTNATAMVNAPRQFHVEVLQALEVIKTELFPSPLKETKN